MEGYLQCQKCAGWFEIEKKAPHLANLPTTEIRKLSWKCRNCTVPVANASGSEDITTVDLNSLNTFESGTSTENSELSLQSPSTETVIKLSTLKGRTTIVEDDIPDKLDTITLNQSHGQNKNNMAIENTSENSLKEEIKSEKLEAKIKVSLLTEKSEYKNVKWFCEKCKVSFTTPYTLRRHNKFKHETNNSGENRFVCSVCAQAFANISNLHRHQRKASPCSAGDFNARLVPQSVPENLSCSLCKKTFADKVSFYDHGRSIHGENVFSDTKYEICKICGNTLNSRIDHIVHMFNRHKTEHPVLECNICEKKYLCEQNMQMHKQQEHGQKIIDNNSSNVKIEEALTDNSLLGRFKKRGVTIYRCDICDLVANSWHTLLIHIRIHTNEKPYQCKSCEKQFVQVGALNSHVPWCSGRGGFMCEICSKIFKNKDRLKKHNLTHSGEQRFMCTYCNRRFTQDVHLSRHIRTHTGIKDYVCDRCGKAFIQKGDLVSHIRTHTGVTPYTCKLCNRSFNQSGVYKKHMRSHTHIPKTVRVE